MMSAHRKILCECLESGLDFQVATGGIIRMSGDEILAATFINTMESMDANTVDATPPEGEPNPGDAQAKPAAKKKLATKK